MAPTLTALGDFLAHRAMLPIKAAGTPEQVPVLAAFE